MSYFDTIDKALLDYYHILEPNIPEWLDEYIDTDEMKKIGNISMSCGTIYSDLFDIKYNITNLDHSIGVALIVWHFTHSKVETLAGLFHDIATPVFKHCIDFMNGDYLTQESTEDLTSYIITNSSKIMKLLTRDGIKVSDVDNYHLYPIADNESHRLSADRLEYTLSDSLFTYSLASYDEIKAIYSDISVYENEDMIDEIGLSSVSLAEKLVDLSTQLSLIYRKDENRYSMQLLADILARLSYENVITKSDLYTLKESEIIDIISKSKYGKVFEKWRKADKIYTSLVEPKGVYFVHHGTKVRYIVPLVCGKRIIDISAKARQMIENNLAYDMSKYIYLDFDLKEV